MTDNHSAPAIDSAKYRQVLGHFPTGVVIVTAMTDDGPAGMAIGSFSSLSLDPAQVLYCPAKTSGSWAKLRTSPNFCVNVLAEDQEDVCRIFGGRNEDKFAEIGWKRSANGSPLINGVLAYIDCTISAIVDGGDHDIVIGDVTDLEVVHEGSPLIFFRGGYGRVTY
ncbi:MAG: flavin reductase [Actinobacteria bacterium]|nr:flavin reductase [Actinomycetota bacterium]